jgi:uncharacterized membrane protein HdeD (DUF308 family)
MSTEHGHPAVPGAPPPLTGLERLLVWVLRVTGGSELLAVIAVFMPFRWSAEAHALLGLGTLPEMPVLLYLIRSASLLYAVHGVMILFMSRDVRRNSRLITVFGVLSLVQGIILLFVDYEAGLPKWWMLWEAAVYWTMATAILFLQQSIRRKRAMAAHLATARSA